MYYVNINKKTAIAISCSTEPPVPENQTYGATWCPFFVLPLARGLGLLRRVCNKNITNIYIYIYIYIILVEPSGNPQIPINVDGGATDVISGHTVT